MAIATMATMPTTPEVSSGVLSLPLANTPTNDTGSTVDAGERERYSSDSTIRDRPTSPDDIETGEVQDGTPPYHVFTKPQKWFIVGLVSLASSFSPLSSNIYFPAINSISLDLDVSEAKVAFTITVYMIMQGISPSIFGAISDAKGRRITFIAALLVYNGANLALAFTSNFPMLLALRGVQAAGSSATISISVGVISDMASARERGRFIGTNAGMRMVGQALGPVIGGLLNSAWGFRSIFWFLFCFGLLVLILLVIFLPETERKIAGNGSNPLSGTRRPIFSLAKSTNVSRHLSTPTPKQRPFKCTNILKPLIHVFKKDIFILLLWGAMVYTIWSMVTSSTTTVLLFTFPRLTQWQIGLCFLPNGIGCVLGSISTGWLLDKTFRRVETEYCKRHGLDATSTKPPKDFPFERARLPLIPYFSLFFVAALALYGPSYEFNDLRRGFAPNLIASLGLQFIIAFSATAVFNINSTMLVDNFPDGAAGATATNNLVRCLIGAAGVATVQPLINALRIRNAFLVLTGVAIFFSPLIYLQWKLCEKWRLQRQKQQQEA